jgi:hypothetical protein
MSVHVKKILTSAIGFLSLLDMISLVGIFFLIHSRLSPPMAAMLFVSFFAMMFVSCSILVSSQVPY